MTSLSVVPPTPDAVAANAVRIEPWVRRTPTWWWEDRLLEPRLPAGTRLLLKLELFQHTGSFKVRGALTAMLGLSPDQLAHGVTAVSAGNHAAAVAYAAHQLGTTARVVMPRTASPARVALCRAWGGEPVFVADVHEAFPEGERIAREEGRTMIHPFEGPEVATGTGTLGLELIEQAPELEAVIVPVGGGGLAAGVASCLKQVRPHLAVFGVEAEGAASMTRSLAAGSPQPTGTISTIADSLSPPYSLPYSFELCRRFLDDVITVSDDALCDALHVLFRGAKLAVEPAGAAATAALLGPLRDRLAGKRVGLIVCGANLDHATYARYLERGADAGSRA